MRIAVIHVGWPVQGYARDLVNGLASLGHDVNFVATPADDRGLIDNRSLRCPVTLLGNTGPTATLLRRLRRGLAAAGRIPLSINPPAVLREADRFFSGQPRYDLMIGVEKAGLEMATHIGKHTGIPVVYYSLELYVEGHPELRRFAWQRASEIHCHTQSRATIVQDRFRWDVLRKANGIADDRVFFLPVGMATGTDAEQMPPRRSSASNECRLLSLGAQGRNRYTRELIGLASGLPGALRLHLHGPCHERWLARLDRSRLPSNLELTTDLLPEAELPELLARADIGLALYRQNVANDRLTAYSSQKVAAYLQAGLPLIAFRSAPYEDLMAMFRCGELIDSLDDIGDAAMRILNRYSDYSAASHHAFAAIYRLDRYWPDLAAFLDRLCDSQDSDMP